jgi:peptidoglycan/LPS O-acetylase OafA/YrhL
MENRLGYVDSLRGFAALAVIYAHTANHYLLNGEISSQVEHNVVSAALSYVDIGKIAVLVFFAISGFVIPYSLFRPSPTPLKSFGLTRFFRLYPVYWVSIFVWVGLVFFMREETTPLGRILINLTMLQQFLGVKNVIELFWTLQIELIFYMFCALLFAMGRLRTCRQIALASALSLAAALALAAARWRLETKLPVALPLSLSVMFWGFLWRRAMVEKLPEARALIGKLTSALFVTLLPVCILAYSRDLGEHETWWRYANTYFAALTLFMLFTTRIRIATPATLFLGRISYSVYLFGVVGQEFAMALHPLLPASTPIHVTVALAMIFTLPIAALTYRWIEMPGVALGKTLRRRAEARAPAGAPGFEQKLNFS